MRRGKFGVLLQELTEELQQVFGVKRGVVISDVETESSAAIAGLQRGDVLTEVNGRKVRTVNQVKNAIGLLNVGERVEVRFIRENQQYITDVTVGESDLTVVSGVELASHLEGMVFENYISNGRPVVAISSVRRGSRMEQYGFKRGDIVLSVNNLNVSSVEDMMDAVQLQTGKSVVDIQRGRYRQTVVVQ